MKKITHLRFFALLVFLFTALISFSQRGYFYTYTFTVDTETVSSDPYDIRITTKYKLPPGASTINCSNAVLPGGAIPDYQETLSAGKGQTVEFKIPILECARIISIEIDVYNEENKGYTKLGRFKETTKAYEDKKFSKKTGLIVAYDDINSHASAKDLRFIIKEYNKSE